MHFPHLFKKKKISSFFSEKNTHKCNLKDKKVNYIILTNSVFFSVKMIIIVDQQHIEIKDFCTIHHKSRDLKKNFDGQI